MNKFAQKMFHGASTLRHYIASWSTMRLAIPQTQQTRILIVDDDLTNTQIAFETLCQAGFRVSVACDGKSCLAAIQSTLPDLILLNVLLADADGLAICTRLKMNSMSQNISIIVSGDWKDELSKLRILSNDSTDYIVKPFQPKELLARVSHQLALQEAKRTIKALQKQMFQQVIELEMMHRKLAQEVTERLKIEQALAVERAQLKHNASHDALTQLANRKLLLERIEQTLQRVNTQPHAQIALLFIDLDRFKVVNDSLGHEAGDRLLVSVAQQLKLLVRATDTVARFGGDEFIILLDPIQQPEDAVRCAERLIQALRSPLHVEGQDIFLTPSIGIAIGTAEYTQASDLLRDADIAMYQAKGNGKARYQIFQREMYTQTLMQHQLEQDLRQAIKQQGLHLHFQPTICLSTGELTGFEALTRWHHPVQGIIPPSNFIPLAEETGLIVSLGEWVFQATCQQLVRWESKFGLPDNFRVSVNISMKQLQDPHFFERIIRILEQTGIAGERLRLEITESVFMHDPERLLQLLTQLRTKGIELSIDDFGTGYSSLSYLHRLPVNYLKVDQSFVEHLGQGEENQAIVSTILTLAHQSRLETIAEGVETVEQFKSLRELGCNAAQGYLFARPLPVEGAELLLQSVSVRNIALPWIHLWESVTIPTVFEWIAPQSESCL